MTSLTLGSRSRSGSPLALGEVSEHVELVGVVAAHVELLGVVGEHVDTVRKLELGFPGLLVGYSDW